MAWAWNGGNEHGQHARTQACTSTSRMHARPRALHGGMDPSIHSTKGLSRVSTHAVGQSAPCHVYLSAFNQGAFGLGLGLGLCPNR